MQLASEVHVVAQALPEQVYGEHCVTFESLQLPSPSHDCPFCWPMLQVVAPQLMPESYCLQAPLPSQLPFLLQLAAPSSGQSLSGSESSATFPQVPSAPEPFLVALHA